MKELSLREKIRNRRMAMGITQTQLAEKVGIRQATLSDYENGKTQIRAETLEKIFNVLEMKVY